MRDPIQLSPLGFGCAPIMGKIGKNQALRALDQAFDLGVTHFDVARSYGFGRAEQVVGRFLKSKRDKVTITSKFGVVPPTLSLRTRTIIPIARTVANLFPQIRGRLKNKSGQLLAKRRFDVFYAEQCLRESLSQLATDYIDIYLIHEPIAESLENPEEIFKFLENSVAAGKVRRWGFSYGSTKDYSWASRFGGDLIQFEGNFSTLTSCSAIIADARQRIVTRPFSGGVIDSTVLETKLKEVALTSVMQEMNASLADVSLSLAHYIAGQSGSVVCSMFTPEHIRKNVRAINEISNDKRLLRLFEKILSNHCLDE